MEIEIKQSIDEAYFKEYYVEWLGHRSKYRKWQDKAGVIFLVLGVMICLVWNEYLPVAVLFVGLGVSMIFDYYFTKMKWMKDRIGSRVNNTSSTFIFEENQFRSIGPFTESKGGWNFFAEAVETEKGLFLIPDKGASIYLQKTSFNKPEDVYWVVQKVVELKTTT